MSPASQARVNLIVAALAYADADKAYADAFDRVYDALPWPERRDLASGAPEAWAREVLPLLEAAQNAEAGLRGAARTVARLLAAEQEAEALAPMIAAHAAEAAAE